MIASGIIRLAKGRAAAALALRAGVIGLNFAVMLGLAALLGLERFGALVVLWGLALVAATLMSVGGPLWVLAAVTGGQSVPLRAILRYMLVYPAMLCLSGGFIAQSLWPGLPWGAELAAGFTVNLLACLASLMRGFGSLNASMALRDAGPQLALFCAALGPGTGASEDILTRAALSMGALAVIAVFWCLRHPSGKRLIRRGPTAHADAMALWGTSILGMALAQIDIVVGGLLLSPEQIGLYALLRRVANLVALPVSVATWVSAGPVSTAHRRGDSHALRQASLQGSRIALIPGVGLFLLGCGVIPALGWFIPASEAAGGAFAILLCGALMQVILASGFTVATLCGLAHFAAAARMVSLLAYLCAVALVGQAAGLVLNATAYAVALTLGSLLLWQMLRLRLGLDTSAAPLLRRREGGWKLS